MSYLEDRLSVNLHLHPAGYRLPLGVSDGKSVGGGALGRDLETPRVRRPNLRHRRIKADTLGVGDVVTDLCGFAPPDDCGRSGKSAYAEI